MTNNVTARKLAWGMNLTSWMKRDENGFVKCFRNGILRRLVENVLRLDTETMYEFIGMCEEMKSRNA